MEFKNENCNSDNVVTRNLNNINFFFNFEIVKIKFKNKIHMFFYKMP